jgi:hypothetical protein
MPAKKKSKAKAPNAKRPRKTAHVEKIDVDEDDADLDVPPISPPPRSSTPKSTPEASEAEGTNEENDEDEEVLEKARPSKPGKSKGIVLTVEQKEDMVEWLQDNDMLYNKKKTDCKDVTKKALLWKQKAVVWEMKHDMLTTWFQSMRTRFGKLTKDGEKSGSGTTEPTERDLWILNSFQFMKCHIHRHGRKQMGNLRANFLFIFLFIFIYF